MVHPEIGMRLMERIEADLTSLASIEMPPKFEGRQMTMVLAPKSKKKN